MVPKPLEEKIVKSVLKELSKIEGFNPWWDDQLDYVIRAETETLLKQKVAEVIYKHELTKRP